MAITSPVIWQQNSGATNTASMMRLADGGAAKGSSAGSALLAGRGGVLRRATGYNLLMSQVGGGNFTVNLEPGMCYVPGTEALLQGGYWFVNDATLNISGFAAAHATQNRIDTVYVKINDAVYSGASNNAQVLIATGTAGSGVAASLAGINNVFKLGEVTIRAASTTILTGDISNNGRYFSSPGGITVTRSDESTEDGLHTGDISYYNSHLRVWDGTANLWRSFAMPKMSTSSGFFNPQADDIFWNSTTKEFNRYTGSVWEAWKPQTERAQLRQTIAQNLTTSTWTPITFTTEDKDTLNGHSTVTSTSRYVCQRAGSYEFTGGITFAPHGTGSRITKWMKNGADVNGSQVSQSVNSGSFDSSVGARPMQIDMIVGDYVELAGWQNSGTTLATSAATIGQATMSVKYLGA